MTASAGVGLVIADRFIVERQVASGGNGVVYRATDRTTNRLVALKVAFGDIARFEREIRLLATLDHPRIVRYIAHGKTDDDRPWVAMEWIAGETLGRLLSRRVLEVDECIAIGRAIADALAAAHARGIVHRDVKPGNIMLEGGLIHSARLIDFGVARAESEATLNTASTLVGTPSYMAPEQARGEPMIGPAADVFALGAVLYRCLTQRPPFLGDGIVAVLAKVILEDPIPVRELRPDVPPALDDLVNSMMSKTPARRPPDGKAVALRMDALDVHVAPAPMSQRAITGQELRVASAIVIGPSREPDRLRAVLERELGGAARVERLRDGSMVVLVHGRGTAVDAAAGAASAALALRTIDDVPIAISTGRAELGGDRPPVGEVIDRAAALLRTTEVGRITLDAVTESLLDDRFARQEGLLLGRSDGDGARRLLGRVTPFVGRNAELAAAVAAVEQCADDRSAKALLVIGPAGSGKSRLRHEIVARVAEAPIATVWVARADPMGAQTALGVANQLLRQLVGIHEGDAPDVMRRKLVDRVRVPDAERVATFLGASLGLEVPREHAAIARDSVLLGDQVRRAWIDFLDAETETPVMLVLEDLHWADRASVALFESALSLFADRPLAVIGFARPEVDEAFPMLFSERALQRVQLGPLSKRAAEQLVHAMLGKSGERLAPQLVETSGGNAFYLEELIRSAAEGRDALPQSVLAMAQSRIEALDADDRRLLRAASVFGRVFWEEGVAALLGASDPVPAAEIQRRLERLAAMEVVLRRRQSTFAGAAELAFRHTLLREGAYAMLTDADRELGHRLAAEWLAAAGSTDAAALAEHFERGAEPERAAEWFVRAAEDALEANDLVGAVDLAARAGSRCEGVLQGRARALEAVALRWQGRLPEALAKAMDAIGRVAPGSAAWADAQMARSTALLATGRANELPAQYDETLPVIQHSSSPKVMDAAAHIGRCLLQGGHGDMADVMLAHVEEKMPDDPAIVGRIEYSRSFHAMYSGDASRALDATNMAIELLDRSGDTRSATTARINLGYTYLSTGLYAEAETTLRAALYDAQRLGLVTSVIGAKENLGWTLARLGKLDEALAMERDTVRTSVRTGDRRFEGGARVYVSAILLQMGDLAGAEREARAAMDVVVAIPPMFACAVVALADVMLAKGRNREALLAAQRAMEIVETGGVSEEEGAIYLSWAECLRAAGHHPEAREAILTARTKLLERASRIDRPEVRAAFLENVPEHARTLRLAAEWATA